MNAITASYGMRESKHHPRIWRQFLDLVSAVMGRFQETNHVEIDKPVFLGDDVTFTATYHSR